MLHATSNPVPLTFKLLEKEALMNFIGIILGCAIGLAAGLLLGTIIRRAKHEVIAECATALVVVITATLVALIANQPIIIWMSPIFVIIVFLWDTIVDVTREFFAPSGQRRTENSTAPQDFVSIPVSDREEQKV